MIRKVTNFLILLPLLSGCTFSSHRASPDEFSITQYKPLVMPDKVTLPAPDSNVKYMGYTSARLVIQKIFDLGGKSTQNAENDGVILKEFGIKQK